MRAYLEVFLAAIEWQSAVQQQGLQNRKIIVRAIMSVSEIVSYIPLDKELARSAKDNARLPIIGQNKLRRMSL